MFQKTENSNLPFINLSFFENDQDLPLWLKKRIGTVKKQLREDLKSRKSLRLAANSRIETIFNLRNALLNWSAEQGESVLGLMNVTEEMVTSFTDDNRFHGIAGILKKMLRGNEPLLQAMDEQGILDRPEITEKRNDAYADMKSSVMNLPDSLAQVILNGIQGTCYFEYVSIAVMDILETGESISASKIAQLESIATNALKQKRKFNTVLLRSMSLDEEKQEKANYRDLSLQGLTNGFSAEEPEYDYNMLISRNPKFKG
jgi:hypothetical protein